MNKGTAVVLVSGGMDSAVVCAIAKNKYNLALLHINYGQRTEERELKAFNSLADLYTSKKRLVVDFDHLKKIGGTSLIGQDIEIPGGLSRRAHLLHMYLLEMHNFSVLLSHGQR